jgi:hypothetical protein
VNFPEAVVFQFYCCRVSRLYTLARTANHE